MPAATIDIVIVAALLTCTREVASPCSLSYDNHASTQFKICLKLKFTVLFIWRRGRIQFKNEWRLYVVHYLVVFHDFGGHTSSNNFSSCTTALGACCARHQKMVRGWCSTCTCSWSSCVMLLAASKLQRCSLSLLVHLERLSIMSAAVLMWSTKVACGAVVIFRSESSFIGIDLGHLQGSSKYVHLHGWQCPFIG